MLLVTHSLVSATLAQKIQKPLWYIPLALAVHLLMDAIPHWDLGISFKKRTKKQNLILAFLDGMSGLVIVFFLFQYQKAFSPHPWLGITAGLAFDFLEAPALFLNLPLVPQIDYLHSKVFHQKSKNLFQGVLPQVIIIGICLLI